MPGVLNPKQARRIASDVQHGNLSSVWKQLWSHGIASLNSDAAAGLHKRKESSKPLEARPPIVPMSATTSQGIFTLPHLEKALLNFRPGKAHDALSWSRHTCAQLFHWPALTPHILSFLDHLVRGRLPDAVTIMRTGSRLITLNKATAGTLRPVTIPTVVRETVSTLCY